VGSIERPSRTYSYTDEEAVQMAMREFEPDRSIPFDRAAVSVQLAPAED
jgi:hypothetical protein